jgi:hypothetical protein
MKPLLSTPITRANKDGLGDWIPAKDQATMDGLRDFARRQEQRRLQAQRKTTTQVVQLKRQP